MALRIERLTRERLERLLPTLRRVPLADTPYDGTWWAAFDGRDVCGVVHIVQQGRSRLLDDLWVRPHRRGRGLGRDLIAFAQQRAPSLWLISDRAEIAYYEAAGFRLGRALPKWVAARYGRVGLWPRDRQLRHRHYAMQWRRYTPHFAIFCWRRLCSRKR